MWGLPLKDAQVLKPGITKISIKMKLIILNHPCLKLLILLLLSKT